MAINHVVIDRLSSFLGQLKDEGYKVKNGISIATIDLKIRTIAIDEKTWKFKLLVVNEQTGKVFKEEIHFVPLDEDGIDHMIHVLDSIINEVNNAINQIKL
jgi:hypothetical protein